MQFYMIKQPKAGSREDRLGRIDVLKSDETEFGEPVRCERCSRPLTMLVWLPPFRIELTTWGKRHGDFTLPSDDVVVSERFLSVYKKAKLRGLSNIAPVDIIKVRHRGSKPTDSTPNYFKADVVLSATTIDQKASGYVWKNEAEVCPQCLFDTLKRYSRLVVKEDTWQGEDIFYPRGGNGPIVSERFRDVFNSESLVGAVFTPVEEESYDFYPWES